MMDSWLKARDQEIAAGTYDDDEDDDPVEFLEAPRTSPVAEPPAEPQEDSRLKRDLFK
jgi:hypothetical protein